MQRLQVGGIKIRSGQLSDESIERGVVVFRRGFFVRRRMVREMVFGFVVGR